MQTRELNLTDLDVRYGRLRVADRRREAQLLASLAEQGQQDAILVVGGEAGYIVVDGHKRVRALRRLKRDTVRAAILELPAGAALAAAYRAASRQGYSAIEDGWLVYELHRVFKWDLASTAAGLGRSKSWASRRLGLVEALPDAVLEGVRRGELGAWSAMKHLLPLARANKTVAIRANELEVWVLSDNLEIARHRRSYDRSAVIEDPKHVAGIVALKRRAFTARQEKRFLGFGSEAKEYYEGLLGNQVHPVRHIAKIMELAATYGEPEVLAAVREALKYKAFGAAYVQSILFQKRTAKGLGEILPLTIPQKPDWNEIRTKQPDLDIYDKLLDLDNSGEEDKKDEQPK
jgi:ParB-like chromosome segregation protein Spo0J